jgi:hypothetical protein
MHPAEAAVALLTAHRTGSVDRDGCAATIADVVAEVGVDRLLAAEIELASGILDGVEMVVNRILSDQNLLALALTRRVKGKPLTAREIRADAEAALGRIGTTLARRT